MSDSSVESSLNRIRCLLEADDDAFPIESSINSSATDAQISWAEREISLKFPDDVRDLYRLADGQDDQSSANLGFEDEYRFGLFPSAAPRDLAFLFVPLESLVELIPQGMPGWVDGWLPIGYSGFGDLIVVDLSTDEPAKYGRILQFNHEYASSLPVAPSLAAYLKSIADDLESGTLTYSPDVGLSREDGIDFDEACRKGLLEGAPV